MADRVKYFVLGLLFLVVAGVIAYDNWNSKGTPDRIADHDDEDRVDVSVKPNRKKDGELAVRPPNDELPFKPGPKPDPKPDPRPDPKPDPRPDPKPDPAPKPKPKVQDKVHVVRSGENLEAIALKYYGTRRGIQWIVKRNGLRDANTIFAKQKLIIPARAESKPGSVKAKPAVKKTPGKVPSRYVVKASDGDLYAICRRFYGTKGEGARVARIMEDNQLWSAKVKPGAVLILPPK